jgi:hypothetical protein
MKKAAHGSDLLVFSDGACDIRMGYATRVKSFRSHLVPNDLKPEMSGRGGIRKPVREGGQVFLSAAFDLLRVD